MKKTIKILAGKMGKLQEKKDGTLQGGFASIRGGFKSIEDPPSTNNNTTGCSNTHDCTHSTNLFYCTNSGVCFA